MPQGNLVQASSYAKRPRRKGVISLPADNGGEGQRPSSADDSMMREAVLTQCQAGEDHARGVAAMPQSTNAPTSLSAQHGSQQAAPGDDASSARHAHPGPGVSEQESGARHLCSYAAKSVARCLLQVRHYICYDKFTNSAARKESRPMCWPAGSCK